MILSKKIHNRFLKYTLPCKIHIQTPNFGLVYHSNCQVHMTQLLDANMVAHSGENLALRPIRYRKPSKSTPTTPNSTNICISITSRAYYKIWEYMVEVDLKVYYMGLNAKFSSMDGHINYRTYCTIFRPWIIY